MPHKVKPVAMGKIVLGLVMASCTAAFAQAANVPPRPLTGDQATTDLSAPKQQQSEARDRRSRDRPPPESGRPFIGPRTTQGLAEDAIARSNPR